ncbi:MAG: hypothetical protein ABIB47_01315 [Candidatus Woesearchaeota archaeon]
MVNAYDLGQEYEALLTKQADVEDRPKITILRRALKKYCGDGNGA